jgi:hypothetical protein
MYTIYTLLESRQIVFEAIIGTGAMSDIALDDIELTEGYCHSLGENDVQSGMI